MALDRDDPTFIKHQHFMSELSGHLYYDLKIPKVKNNKSDSETKIDFIYKQN